MIGAAGNFMAAMGGGEVIAPYWRLTMSGNFHNNFTVNGIAELQLRAVPGGSSIATGGTASASSNLSAAYPPANAFDGNTSTDWASTDTPYPHWLQYQFPQPVTIREIAITAPLSSPIVLYAPIDISVAYSFNGSNFTTIYQQSGMSIWTAGETRVFTL